MAEQRVQRRLAAILAADVVGYSRLMREDETGTLAQLKTLRKEVFDPRTAEHNGRIVKTMGDGVLVEFASAVDATECAVKIQRSLARRNEDVPEGHRIELRIGINLGDIVVDGEDIYGDGVNVAARLEGLCDTGEVYISAVVHDQVEGKIDAVFNDLGEHTVKNIDKPVRVYRVSDQADAPLKSATLEDPDKPLSLPDKPSVAVLPFENMSGDPEQEYFSDGITEDIITGLSRIRQFFVIARNTTFTYKAQSVDVQAIAKELGVRYVVEGSVRKVGERVRITAQLIDGERGSHIWAERYDRQLEDIFAVQDEITEKIVGVVGPEVMQAEIQRSTQGRSNNIHAWDEYLRGLACLSADPRTCDSSTRGWRCQTPEHDADHGETDEGDNGSGITLEVAGEAPVAADPGERSLHDPAFRQDHESVRVGALNDFQLPAAGRGDGRRHPRPLVAAVGEDGLDEGERTARGSKQLAGAVAILHVGGMDDDAQQQAECIDEDVALAPRDLLARIEALRVERSPPFCAPLALWLSITAADGLASRPSRSRTAT